MNPRRLGVLAGLYTFCGVFWDDLLLPSFYFRRGLISIDLWPSSPVFKVITSFWPLSYCSNTFFTFFIYYEVLWAECTVLCSPGWSSPLKISFKKYFYNFYFLWIENLIKLMYFNKTNPHSLLLVSSITYPKFMCSLFLCLISPWTHLALICAWWWDHRVEHGIVTWE